MIVRGDLVAARDLLFPSRRGEWRRAQWA